MGAAELDGSYDPETALVTTRIPCKSNSWKKKLRSSFQKGSDDLALEISDRTNATQALSEDGSDLGDDSYTKVALAKTELLAERLEVAQQLADAIAYLHSQNVLHRDLKPDNIGFDASGELKVFDFDIARVCPSGEDSSSHDDSSIFGSSNNRRMRKEDETFLMTQKVGSPRYMSPECARREPYNLKADVYSYAVLTHQILTLQKPYDDITDEDHDELVFVKGVRPFIPAGLPTTTKDLLAKSWSHTISDRPNMETIRQVISLDRSEILRLGTIGHDMNATETTAYVLSCSFTSVSDNSKRLKKIKSKPKTISPMPKRESFRASKKNLLSIFKKDKPAKKSLLKGSLHRRPVEEGSSNWVRR